MEASMKVKLVVLWFLVVSTFVFANPPAVNAQTGNCTKAPPMYLHVGDAVMLSHRFVDSQNTTNMQVYRIEAGMLSGAGYIQTGKVFHIVSGPRCIDGWRFWEIREISGAYVLDGVGQSQYFDIQQVSPTNPAPASCSLAPAAYISVGDTIRLSDGYSSFLSVLKAQAMFALPGAAIFAKWDPNQMPVFAAAGSLQQSSLLPKNKSIRVLGGPICSGFRYYQTDVGWVIDGISLTLKNPKAETSQTFTVPFFLVTPGRPTPVRATPVRVTPVRPTPAAVDSTCSSLPSRVEVGDVAFNSSGIDLHAKYDHSTGSSNKFVVPAGAQFTIIAGPYCGENRTWWKIAVDGNNGWLPEANANVYNFSPGTGSQPGTDSQAQNSSCAPGQAIPERLYVGARGQRAQSLGGNGRVRSGPGQSYGILFITDFNQPFTVIGGPVRHTDSTWWQVRFEGDGRTGWMMEGYCEPSGPDYYIEPLSNGGQD
jgi:hypothetical protein